MSALFLTTPISSESKLVQVVGRVLRKKEGKQIPMVYDYLDKHPVSNSSYYKRFKVYEKIGAKG